VEVTDEAAFHRAPHDFERAMKTALHLVTAPKAFTGFRPQREFAEREVLGLGGVDGVQQ
jgi:hypothetical protein